MKCRMNGREVAMPCTSSCELFGDCVAEYRRSLRARKPTNADCGKKPPMNNADEIVRALYLCAAGGQTVLQAAEWCTKAANLIESLQADAASYRQVKNALQREGFDDIEAMISRYKQVTAERDAAVADLYKACKTSPCNNGICVHKNCSGNIIPCEFEWRGLKGEKQT